MKMKKMIATLCVMGMLGASAMAEPFSEIVSGENYQISLEQVLRLSPDEGESTIDYKVQQGCCTDGTYAYFVLENQVIHDCCLIKVRLSDWTEVDRKYGMDLDHGNDLTYNANRGQIIAVHNGAKSDTISFIDPETLEVVETKKLPMNLYCMAYCAEKDQYVVGLSAAYHYVVLDGEFNPVNFLLGVDTGFVRQGVECDENYVYFPQWEKATSINQIMVYDWEGNHVNTVKVNEHQEIESMFHINGETYMAFYETGERGGFVYRADLEKAQ